MSASRQSGIWILVSTFSVLLVPSTATAEPVSFHFSGSVTEIIDPNDVTGGSIEVDDVVFGTYTFESTTPDDDPLPNQGTYIQAMTEWNINIGESQLSLGNLSNIFVKDGPDNDRYDLFARLAAPFGDGVWNAVWNFDDPSGNLVNSAALPVIPPDVVPVQDPPSTVQFTDEPGISVSINLDSLNLFGDLTGDNFVGSDDLQLVLLDWGLPPSDPRADPTHDGFVGGDDLLFVLQGWGEGILPGAGGLSAVPEPSALILSIIGGLGLIGFLRQRRFRIHARPT